MPICTTAPRYPLYVIRAAPRPSRLAMILSTAGRLAAAVRPPEQVCVWRSYLRQRAMLGTYASQHIQHMQKAVTPMHLKLQHVVSDVTSATGLAIIKAILSGERNPTTLAQLRAHNCHHSEAEVARAIDNRNRPTKASVDVLNVSSVGITYEECGMRNAGMNKDALISSAVKRSTSWGRTR
jgi:hypothetical protein